MGKVQKPSGTLKDFLNELLEKVASFREGWLTLQRDVVNKLIDNGSPLVEAVIQRFGAAKLFLVVRELWHRRFYECLTLQPPRESVLCAFGEVQDNVINQAGLKQFLSWATQQSTFNHQTFVTASANPKSLVSVRDVSEAVAAIACSLENPPALKPTVANAQLRNDLGDGINAISPDYTKKCLGGAPAIISDVLAQLGLQQVHIFSLYHSHAVAGLYRGQPQRLDLNLNPPQLVCVNQPGQYIVGGTSYPHPTRISHIFAYKKGFNVTIGNQTFTAKQDDRVIFRIYRYIENHSNQWQRTRIRVLQPGKPWVQGPQVDPEEWPALAGFIRWKVNNDVLELEYLDELDIQEICKYDYIILNAPRLADFQRDDPLEYMEIQSLQQQLAWLSKGPTRIHLEISGGADPLKDRIQPFVQNLKGLIHSLGINDGELSQVTSLPDYDPPITVTAGASLVYQRYERALRLARELGLERLYVHGNDVDLILRKSGSPGEMRAEIQADLFAKGLVVLAVLQRSIDDWQAFLEADYAMAMAADAIEKAKERIKHMSNAGELSKTINQAEKALEEAREELRNGQFEKAKSKAEEARRLLTQKFGILTKASEKAAISLSPVLLAKSFQALIEFAYDYVRLTLGKVDYTSPFGLTKEGEELFQRIVETGYHVTRDPEEYSVAVVPVMWPELPVELNPTGAGDICSGISLVYSGF